MSGPNDVDRLLHDWDEVASTAKPPAQDPRRERRATSALPVSMLVVAVLAIAVVAIVGRTAPLPAAGDASFGASGAATEAPSAEPAATDPGVVVLVETGEDDDGRFRLTLASDGTTFNEGETISAGATVEFLGPEGLLNARHGGSPVVFSVEEIGGTRSAGGVNTDSCEGTTYQRGETVAYPWSRSGGYSPNDPSPETQFVVEYLEGWPGASDGELRLPAGIWRLSAAFDVMEEECATDAPSSNLAASVTLRVLPDSGAVSEPPVPASPVPTTPAPELSSLGVFDDGRFRVELTTDGTTFQEGETIRAGAEVAFLGPEGSLRVGHGSPPMTFAVEEIGGTRSVGGGADMMCLRSTFQRDEAVPYPWQRGGSYSSDNPGPNDLFAVEYLADWNGAQDGELRLPAGTWRLSASLDVAEGDCGPHNPRTASVVIHVEPAPGSEGPTASPEEHVLSVGPVVVCEGVTPEDCEHAVALVRAHGPDPVVVAGRDAYTVASIVLVADTCPPGVVCDRQYPFDATVVYAFGNGEVGTASASSVRGMDGPEEALFGQGLVAPWMLDLIDDARDLVPVPIALPRLPENPVPCEAALTTGTLREIEHHGVGLEVGDVVYPVQWPFAFAARRDDEGLALLDASGAIVGWPGDRVEVGGAPGEKVLVACGGVHRAPAPEGP